MSKSTCDSAAPALIKPNRKEGLVLRVMRNADAIKMAIKEWVGEQ
jgi:hypothetical protein